jgi:hypothetical protein
MEGPKRRKLPVDSILILCSPELAELLSCRSAELFECTMRLGEVTAARLYDELRAYERNDRSRFVPKSKELLRCLNARLVAHRVRHDGQSGDEELKIDRQAVNFLSEF